MSAYKSVCESVCLSIKKVYSSQNNPNWSTQRKYVVVTLDQTGNSGGERVCPVFQGLLD